MTTGSATYVKALMGLLAQYLDATIPFQEFSERTGAVWADASGAGCEAAVRRRIYQLLPRGKPADRGQVAKWLPRSLGE